MTEWVVGFLLDEAAQHVVLIRKNRPAWQAGHLNGVGGRLEPEETPQRAMIREFAEETGVQVAPWQPFARLYWEEGLVHFFRLFAPMAMLRRCHTVTDEPIRRVRIDTLGALHTTPNLLWLVPLAAHRHDTYQVIDVVETATLMRQPGRAGEDS